MRKITDKLLNWATIIDPQTLNQAINTSKMPFIVPHLALMPDAHLGMGATVGSVIPTEGAVIPSAVGVDIGCGMIAVKTQFTVNDLKDKVLGELLHSIERSVPVSVAAYNTKITESAKNRINELEKLAGKEKIKFYNSLTKTWHEQLGSLGSGNHFIEVTHDEEDYIWLFLHSGSRGIGNKIGMHHIRIAKDFCKRPFIQRSFGKLPDPDLAYLMEGTPEFDDYIIDLHWAQEFARMSRDEMMDRIVKDLSYFMGEPVKEIERVNCHHNFTRQEKHMGATRWITRKGAISAQKDQLGLIPGSMGTASYVVTGKGNPLSFCSAPHGAGRVHSRTEAKQLFTLSQLKDAMQGIEFRADEAFIDEIPQAYKSIDQVMEDATDLVEVVHVLRQIVNVKGK